MTDTSFDSSAAAANDPAFEHIISEVLGQGTDPESPMRKAFAHCKILELPDFLSLTSDIVDNLSYTTGTGSKKATHDLDIGTQRRILLFLDFLQW